MKPKQESSLFLEIPAKPEVTQDLGATVIPMPDWVRDKFKEVVGNTEPIKLGTVPPEQARAEFYRNHWQSQARKHRR